MIFMFSKDVDEFVYKYLQEINGEKECDFFVYFKFLI